MNKKAFLRTVEVALAIIGTFLIAYLIFPGSSTPQETENLGILPVLEQNPAFRKCVVSLNHTCMETFFEEYLPANYDFAYDVTENPEQVHANLPDKEAFSESVYVAGTIALYNPKIIKLYYWRIE